MGLGFGACLCSLQSSCAFSLLCETVADVHIDESTGVLRGVPDTVGKVEVVVAVTLERSVCRLDEARLSWGQERVKEVVVEKVGSTRQRFQITVGQ